MKHTYNEEYPHYFKYLEVNFTIGDEKPPVIFYNHDLKKGRRLNDL